MAEKNITRPADMPKVEHWAVLLYTYVNTPGYDQGDPDERKDIVEYITFLDKKDLEDWITAASQSYDRKSFSVIHVKPAKVTTTVIVGIE